MPKTLLIVLSTCLCLSLSAQGDNWGFAYNDKVRISPLGGFIWSGISKDEPGAKTHGKPNGTIGLQIEYGGGGLSLGRGLTDGLCLPIHLRYNYCFPKTYGDLTGGMHFVSVGLGLYMKGGDKPKRTKINNNNF